MGDSRDSVDLSKETAAGQPSDIGKARAPIKRARSPGNKEGKQDDEQGRKRARGRPRLDMDPETVADRRRAQLRVAQRAYRDRKESTLSTLEKRVQRLEQKHESIGSDLNSLYEAFVAQGVDALAPALITRLKFLVDQMATTDERDSASMTRGGSTSSGSERRISSSNPDTSIPEAVSGDHQPILSGGNLLNQARDFDMYSTGPRDMAVQIQDAAPFSSQDIPGGRAMTTYKSDPLAPMPLYLDCIGVTASYAFREKTFGRRMQRAALEAATEMCNQQYPDLECYTAVFGFCLLWETKEEIRLRISRLVQRSTSETLDDWAFPFASLGNAGHLTANTPLDKIPAGNPGQEGFLPIGNYGSIGSQGERDSFRCEPFMGPFAPPVERARDSYLDHQMHMLFPDFEGRFYDPNDTELYLRLRGIVIPEQVDYVVAEINLDDFSTEDFDAEPATAPCSHANAKTSDDWRVECLNHGQPGNLQALLPDSFLSRVEWGASTGDAAIYPPASGFHNDGVTRAKASAFRGRKVKVSIDVNRLVAELIQRTVCLGRCPGIRPKHIDQAVRVATTVMPVQ